jgi:hypothetical protein
MPLTMSLTDMDWKESNFYQLGTVAMHRRIRDVGSQMRARDAMLEFMGNSEMLLSPSDPTESLKKLMEIRTAIIDYNGPEAAENTVKEMARVLLEMNKNRLINASSLPGPIGGLSALFRPVNILPGGKGLGLRLAELDLRPDAPQRGPVERFGIKVFGKIAEGTIGNLSKFSQKVPVVADVLEWAMPGWKGFSRQPFEHWPHSIAEAISYSVRYTGAHGNAWDEQKIEEVLLTMHDMGMFINHPEYIQDLRREFHSLQSDRWIAMVRKYWWVIVVASIAIAAEQSIEEQKGGGGGGGGGGHH